MPASPGENPTRPSLVLKICLAGEPAVGKTSVIRRFVSNTFDDRYLVTIGAKVSSRSFTVVVDGTTYGVAATIWDIMGTPGFRELLKDAYFHRVQALLLVCDGTRLDTLHALRDWFNSVEGVAGAVPTVVLVNKSDLAGQVRIGPREAEEVCAAKGWRWLPTSAKTGQNVEEAFALVTRLYLEGLKRTQKEIAPES